MEMMHYDKYLRLGKNISHYRKLKGLSQADLAKKVDISLSHISRIENGRTKLSLALLFALSEALGVAPHMLLRC